jgi:CysZ protein
MPRTQSLLDGLPPARFLRGLGYVFRGAGAIFSSRRLFLLALVPFVVCLAIYAGLFAGALYVDARLVDHLIDGGIWWRDALRWILMVGVAAGILVLGVFTFAAACFIVAGPLYEWLSVAVERRATGDVCEEPFSLGAMAVDLGRSIVQAVVVLAIEVAVLVAGLLFVPVTTVIAFLISAVLLSVEYLDYPMGRRRMPLRVRASFARSHVWELLGFGLPLLFGLMLPFVGVAFLPVGVAGGTLLFCRLAGGGPDCPEPPDEVPSG